MKNFSYKVIPPRFEHKFRGSGLLVMALVGAAVVGVTSLSLAKANSIAINAMGSNKVALQAQQYAAAKGELIRATKYSDLTAQSKTNIGNTGFQDEVVVAAEADVDATTKKKEVTIRVYKTGEATPRSSIVVTRYNKSLDNSIPSGTVLTWYGALGNIPSGFVICDGSNGTPDLRNRFVVGAGSDYTVGDTGGMASITLNTSQLPSHNHGISIDGNGDHYHATMGENDANSPFGIYAWGSYCGSRGGIDWDNNLHKTSTNGWHSHSASIGNTGGNQAHENRPPYYALYYIMKL